MSAREVLQGLAGCPLPAWESIEPTLRVRPLRKGEFLFHADQVQPFVFVVTEGLVKMVYETSEGDSWVKAFAPAGTCFASIMALARQGVTSFSTVAQANSQVVLLLRFLEEFQGIASELSQKDIASYIRITPVALSRIRRRLRARS